MSRAAAAGGASGVLVVDKPAGLTSADVVARVKRLLRARRVGHTGTLDPMATGVLPVVLGEGTKLAPYLLADDKAYEGELELGITTSTLDREGEVLSRRDPGPPDEEALRRVVAQFQGELLQVPPMVSALKHQGQRLHELARAGIEVERAPRPVTLTTFVLTSVVWPRAAFQVACSKGTYVRALVRDVGEALGCGAMLTALRRTRSGWFTLADAVPLDDALPARPLISPADALAPLPALTVDARGVDDLHKGRVVGHDLAWADGTTVRVLDGAGALVAIGLVKAGRVQPVRVLFPD